MKKILDYIFEDKAVAAGVVIAAVIIAFGIFTPRSEKGAVPLRNIEPDLFMVGTASSGAMQTVAFANNTITLPMGVTLEGKGSVTELVPGSSAERAGICVGDVINRVNGR
ncbi:MAG: PDZ domain-containing protein [Candidatus Omnitrophica bacterium]|nr:PDZ domain-containing protein [Candidatus Omnitrophota bacterium]